MRVPYSRHAAFDLPLLLLSGLQKVKHIVTQRGEDQFGTALGPSGSSRAFGGSKLFTGRFCLSTA